MVNARKRGMNNRRVWAAAIFPIGHAEVFGGIWDSDRLHWTRAAAIAEIENHVVRMGLLPMQWTSGAGDLMIGRPIIPATNSGASRQWSAASACPRVSRLQIS